MASGFYQDVYCITLLFRKISDIHYHYTRSLDNMCLFTNFGRLLARKNSIKICGPVIWNKIAFDIRNAPCVSQFKKMLKISLYEMQ